MSCVNICQFDDIVCARLDALTFTLHKAPSVAKKPLEAWGESSRVTVESCYYKGWRLGSRHPVAWVSAFETFGIGRIMREILIT